MLRLGVTSMVLGVIGSIATLAQGVAENIALSPVLQYG